MPQHREPTPSVMSGALLWRRRRAWIAFGGVLIAIVALVRVTITDPRVVVRWEESVSSAERTALEGRYELRNGRPYGNAWRYQLGDLSRENIRALTQDQAVDDTGYIDRDALISEGRDIRVAIRYPFSDLGLVLLAPAVLLYFGWREFGYLSLSVAAFPLLARGLTNGGMRLEAGSVCAGLGAALHGSGLVSLAGAWMAALGASGRLRSRVGRLLRVAVWGGAAYLGWVAVYLIVLNLPISPDAGPAAFSSWRPWLVDDVRAGRVSAAFLSATSARDLLMTAWVVGAPLVAVAVSLRRRYPHEVRAALWYMPPSVLFVIVRWPFEGIGGGMDLVVAGFPALYALAWVCAHDSKRANIAAALLVSAHYAFWRVVLDERFWPLRVD